MISLEPSEAIDTSNLVCNLTVVNTGGKQARWVTSHVGCVIGCVTSLDSGKQVIISWKSKKIDIVTVEGNHTWPIT